MLSKTVLSYRIYMYKEITRRYIYIYTHLYLYIYTRTNIYIRVSNINFAHLLDFRYILTKVELFVSLYSGSIEKIYAEL